MNDEQLRELVKKYLAEENWFEAWRYSTRVWEKNADDWFYLAVACNGLGNVPMAVYYLEKASKMNPEKYSEIFYEALAEVKRPEKFAIFCVPEDDDFIKDIYEVFKNIFDTRLVITRDGSKIKQSYDWADIVWLEWGNELTVFITNNFEKTNKRIICRLHSYEVFSDFPIQINWGKIDGLVFVGENIFGEFCYRYPEICVQVVNKVDIIPNGLDLNKWQFKEREKGHKISVVARIMQTKNPPMWLQVLKILLKSDPNYELHIAGPVQSTEYEYYIRNYVNTFGLKEKLFLYGNVNNISEFLDDKNYLLSTSIREGHPYNIMEAMAQGIKPLIGYYPGVFEQFPKELVFSEVTEVLDILERDYNSDEYRRFIEKNYSLERQISQIYTIILKLIENTEYSKDSTTESRPSVLKNEEYTENSYQNSDVELRSDIISQLQPYLSGENFSNSLFITYSFKEKVITRIEYLKEIAKEKKVIHIGFADHIDLIKKKIDSGLWLHKILIDTSEECYGIDIDFKAVEYVKENFGIDNVFCLDVVKDEIPEQIMNKHFDLLILGEVIEHIGNPVEFLSTIRKKFKPIVNQIVITTPNAFSAINLSYAQRNSEIINSDHRFWFTPYTLSKILTDAGYKVSFIELVESYNPTENISLIEKIGLLRDTIIVVADF